MTLSDFKGHLPTARSQQVLPDGCLSELVMILFGVLQGSVIGPILFILYMVELFDIIAAYGVNCHCNADDMQVYSSVPVTMSRHFFWRTAVFNSISGCRRTGLN